MKRGSHRQIARLTARGALTRQRIIAAAADLIFTKGVRGTSLEDIMAESGVSKSQLYHYFADKDAIIQAVVHYQTKQVFANQLPYLTKLDSMAALRRWRNSLVRLCRARGNKGGCPIGGLANELADASESARMALVGSFETWGTHVENGLKTMQASGELSADADPRALSISILGAVQGGLLLTKTMRSEKPLELALDMAMAHVERFRSRGVSLPGPGA